MSAPKKILLTGGTGFLGKCVKDRLLPEGFKVRVLTRKRIQKGPGVEYVQGDLREINDCRRAVKGMDIVVHIGGAKKNTDDLRRVNISGTQHIIESSINEKIRRFVHISSTGVIGADPFEAKHFDESSPCQPSSEYEKSKHEAEKLIPKCNGFIDSVILRPTNIYGANDPNYTLLSFIKAIKKGRFAYIGGKDTIINVINVNDVANAIVKAIDFDGDINGEIFHISDSCSLGKFVGTVSEEIGVDTHFLDLTRYTGHILRFLMKTTKSIIPGIHSNTVYGRLSSVCNVADFNTAKFERFFNSKPVGNSQDGIRKLIDWYREIGAL